MKRVCWTKSGQVVRRRPKGSEQENETVNSPQGRKGTKRLVGRQVGGLQQSRVVSRPLALSNSRTPCNKVVLRTMQYSPIRMYPASTPTIALFITTATKRSRRERSSRWRPVHHSVRRGKRRERSSCSIRVGRKTSYARKRRARGEHSRPRRTHHVWRREPAGSGREGRSHHSGWWWRRDAWSAWRTYYIRRFSEAVRFIG